MFRADPKTSALEKLEKDEDGKISLKLKTKIKISSDTYIFRFEFPEFDMSLGLPVGNHVVFSAQIGDEEVVRKYTPISDVKDQSFVDFVIKIYRKGVHPKFPEGGQMTQYLETLQPGSIMQMSGPHGRCTYEGYGRFSLAKRDLTQVRKKIGHIAGGTGITPLYQVI